MNQDAIYAFIRQINSEFFGPALVFLLLGAGIFFTFRLHFVPRYFMRTVKSLFSSRDKSRASRSEGISAFQALTTAVASQVGTGNIVGVSMAMLMGGPGALFWLWISAMFGMSTNFAEAILGQKYKTHTADGHIIGGPAYYIRNGLGSRVLAGIFSVCFIVALSIGIMVQSNSISGAMDTLFHGNVEPIWFGVGLAILVSLILSGGIERIAPFSERVVPVMAGLFIMGCVVFVGLNVSQLVPALADVFKYAFTPKAGVGGAAGIAVMTAVRYGVNRGLFSNEAGLGTTPHAHAIAKVKNAYDQGLIAMVGIAVDLLVCTLTGLSLLLSGALDQPDLNGIQLMQYAFGTKFGVMGDWLIAVSLFFFALSTMVGWYFFCAQNVRYLFGERPIIAYRVIVVALVVLASVIEVPLIWELSDTFNFFVVVANVAAILWLSPKVVDEVRRMRNDFSRK